VAGVHVGPGGAVEGGPVEIDLDCAHRADLPAWVFDAVDECAAAAGGAVAPGVLLEVVFKGVVRRGAGVVVGGGGDLVPAVVRPDGIGGFDAITFGSGLGAHGSGAVGLVVEEAGGPGDEGAGDELADEDDAAARLGGGARADVEAEVELREVAVAWPWDSEDAGVLESEGDEADVMGAAPGVEFEARGEMGEESFGGDAVLEEEEVEPSGGEEGAGHAGRVWCCRLGAWDGFRTRSGAGGPSGSGEGGSRRRSSGRGPRGAWWRCWGWRTTRG